MSTTQSTDTTVSGLNRSQRALIDAHWSSIARHLPEPGVAWEWSELEIKHHVKYRWKDARLIRRAPGRGRWETTASLWRAVQALADEDEAIGAGARGQVLLDAPDDHQGEMQLLYQASTPSSRSTVTRQETLDGDTTPAHHRHRTDQEIRSVTTDKDPTRPSNKEEAAHHPDQRPLEKWCADDQDRGEWDLSGGTSGEIRLMKPG